jgi:outer membrane protein assembly factor BamB
MHNISETVQHRAAHHHRFLALAALGLTLVVALAGAITFLYRTTNHAASSAPAATATPITSSVWSGHNTVMTIKDGVAYIGTVDHAVYALRLHDGKPLWCQSADYAADSAPLVDDSDTIYFTSFGYVGTGRITAMRAGDGKLLWHYSATSQIFGRMLANGTLYAVLGNGDIIALRASDGKLLWHYATQVNYAGGP